MEEGDLLKPQSISKPPSSQIPGALTRLHLHSFLWGPSVSERDADKGRQPCLEEPGWEEGIKPWGPSTSSLLPAWLPEAHFSHYPTVHCPPRENTQLIGCEGRSRKIGPGTSGRSWGEEEERKSGAIGPIQGEMESPHPLFTPQVCFPYVGKCGGPRVSNSSPLTPSTP